LFTGAPFVGFTLLLGVLLGLFFVVFLVPGGQVEASGLSFKEQRADGRFAAGLQLFQVALVALGSYPSLDWLQVSNRSNPAVVGKLGLLIAAPMRAQSSRGRFAGMNRQGCACQLGRGVVVFHADWNRSRCAETPASA
jgi:hypothetical protein